MFAWIGTFLYRNPWTQAVLAFLGALLALKIYGEKRERDGRHDERERQQREETKALSKQKDRANETVKNANDVRREHGNYPTSDSVPDDAQRVLFGDRAERRD